MENNFIYSIQRKLAGHQFYEDPEMPPFGITQYSPVYYHAVYWICKIRDITADDLLSIYKISRIISLIFNFVFAAFIGGIAWRFYNIGKNESFLISMVAFIILQRHGYSRPDSIFNVTVVFTIFSYLSYLEKKGRNENILIPLLVTGFATAFSIFSKQSGIILIALLFFYQFFIMKKFRDALILAFAIGISSYFFLLSFTGPDLSLFYKNAIRGLDNGIVLIWFWYNIVVDFFCTVNGFIFTIMILYSAFFLIQEESKKHSFLGWSLIALFSFATLTGLKHGSTPSYYIEASALALIGFLIIRNQIALPSLLSILAISLGLLHYLMNPKILVPLNKIEKFSSIKYESEKEVFDYVNKHYQLGEDEWVFINKNGWESFLSGMFFEKGLFPHKDIISQKQTFNYSSFDSIYAKGKVKLLITQSDTNIYLGVNFSRYKFLKEINGYKIYQTP